MTRARVIVLDGVDWKHVNEHADVAAPLWRIVGGPAHADDWTGCAAMLRACAAPITPSAVAALLAGRDDGVSWFSSDRYATSQELIRTRPWFPELARYDMTLSLCNVPLTWPAFPLPRGSWMVSGYPVPTLDRGRPWSWPPSFNTDGYPIAGVIADSNGGAGGGRDIGRLRDTETAIVEWYLTQAPRADVEIIWLRSTDAAGHHAWGTPEYDATITHAALLAERLARDVENVIVISDHGFDATESDRCAAYHRTSHGEAARKHGLCGSHSEEGILFARGERIAARGFLPEQKLVEVAGGLLDLLQVPPPPGMTSGNPAWSSPLGAADVATIRTSLAAAGYAVDDITPPEGT